MQSHFFPKLAGSNYKNYWSYAGQVKRKVNCSKLTLEFNSTYATHKERSALKYGQTQVENWILVLRGLFNKCLVERHAKQEILTSINKDQLKDL